MSVSSLIYLRTERPKTSGACQGIRCIVRRFLQIFRGKAGMLGNTRQYLRSDLFTIMKCKNVVRPADPGKNAMRGAGLPFDCPANAKQSSEDLTGSG
jgi:hypothetical protein